MPPTQIDSVALASEIVVKNQPELFTGGRFVIQSATDVRSATTYREWLALVNQCQEASMLMGKVSADHPRYTEAKKRVLSYRQNSELALV